MCWSDYSNEPKFPTSHRSGHNTAAPLRLTTRTFRGGPLIRVFAGSPISFPHVIPNEVRNPPARSYACIEAWPNFSLTWGSGKGSDVRGDPWGCPAEWLRHSRQQHDGLHMKSLQRINPERDCSSGRSVLRPYPSKGGSWLLTKAAQLGNRPA